MSKEHPIMQQMRLTLGALTHVRAFRNNNGQAWYGLRRHNQDGTTTIYNAKPITFGLCPGSADLIGLTSIVITPEMVGRRVAVFTSIEAKGEHTPIQPGQPEWAHMVDYMGGLSGFARTPEEAVEIVEKWKEWK